jgi:isoamylase
MTAESWNSGFARCLGVVLYGDSIDVDEHGEEIQGDTMVLLFNADHATTIPFTLPQGREDEAVRWERMFDTAEDELDGTVLTPGDAYELRPCSVVLLRAVPQPDDAEAPLKTEALKAPEAPKTEAPKTEAPPTTPAAANKPK